MYRPRFSAGSGSFAGIFSPGAGAADSEQLAPRPASQRAIRGVAAGVAVLLLMAALALLFVQQRYDNKVYPAITAGEVSLGGQTVEDARATLNGIASQDAAKTVTLNYGGKSWTATFAQLGITVDVDTTLDQAYGIGREDTARGRLSSFADLLQGTQTVPLTVSFNRAALDQWADTVDAELGLVPRNASLAIDGTTVTIVPEIDGTVVDRDQLATMAMAGAHTLSIQGGPLPVKATVATVRATDLAGAQQQVTAALAKPVKLRYDGKKWTLAATDLSQFITQAVDPSKSGADAFSLALDEDALADWLNGQLADDVNRDPVNAVIAWSNDKSGIIATEPSTDGAKLRPKSLADDVTTSFWSNHHTVDVPVSVLKPAIDSKNLAALGITHRIAVGDSSYEGSNTPRATNIEVGASLLNGTMIAPGATFSFNHSIGVIDVDKGFVEAPVIDGERIGRDVGGGICQVSTTVFRAALYGGMPITEWHPHTYRLAFYELDGWPPGFDASILQPNDDPFSGGDFQFTNSTDSWILVEAYTENEHAYVILYGADTGYDVTFSDPYISDPIKPSDQPLEIVDDTLDPGTVTQTELAEDGLEVDFQRTVTDKDGNELIYDDWDTYFSSRPDVWKVSPDMEGQSPASE